MPTGDAVPHPIAAEIHEKSAGDFELLLRGRLDMHTTGACWRDLEKRLDALSVRHLEIDASRLELRGGIGMALLRYLAESGMTPGAQVSIRGLTEEFQRILNTFTSEDFRAFRGEREPRVNVVAKVGRGLRGFLRELREQIGFIGGVTIALPLALMQPKLMRWGEVKEIMHQAGANALPVVATFSWLVGLVLALEASQPLAQFGAQIYIASMIGFSSLRDTGPLVTAIMLAGRSGSAFAAELGTMKVNEELDALTTMGLDPLQFLVVQRVFAAMLLTPLLSLYAMLMGIIGGMMVMNFLGFTWTMIYHQILSQVQPRDFMIGISKGVIFGIIVGAIGCLRGLQTREGPQAVGVSATRAVVSGILLVIFANTLYSMVQYFFQ